MPAKKQTTDGFAAYSGDKFIFEHHGKEHVAATFDSPQWFAWLAGPDAPFDVPKEQEGYGVTALDRQLKSAFPTLDEAAIIAAPHRAKHALAQAVIDHHLHKDAAPEGN